MARTVKKVFDIAVIAGCVAFFGSVALAGVVPASSPVEDPYPTDPDSLFKSASGCRSLERRPKQQLDAPPLSPGASC